MYATYEQTSGKPTLYFERRILHPVEAVWSAITQSDELAQWFPCAVELDLRVGGEMKFTFPHDFEDWPKTLPGRVTELDPPRVFAFYWGDDHLRFELEEAGAGSGCTLRFTVELDSPDKAARDSAGWHVCLDGLERLLERAPSDRPYDGGGWDAYYEEYKRRGMPAAAPIPDR